MVTVSVVAILASVALPAYQDQIRKGRRSDATTLLADIGQLQERFFMENNTYTANLSSLGFPSGTVKTDKEYYQIQVENPEGCGIANCYRLSAAPLLSAQIEDGELRLLSDGTRQRNVGGVWKNSWN